MRNLRIPQAGEDLSASWARDMVEEVRAQRLSVLPPLFADRGPDGTVLRVRGGAAQTPVLKRTWDIGALSASSITIVRCWYLRSGLWKTPETEPTLALSGTDVTVCAAIDTRAGTVTLSSEPDTESIASGSVYKVPLYVLARPDEDSGWTVACDCRGSMVVLYA